MRPKSIGAGTPGSDPIAAIAPLTRLVGPVPVLDVLRVLWRQGAGRAIGATAVARLAGLTRQSAHRLLRSLVARRVVLVGGIGGRPLYRANAAHEAWPMLSALFDHEAEHAARFERALRQAVEAEPAIAAAWLIDEASNSSLLELVVFVPGADADELAGHVQALRGRLRARGHAFGIRLRVSGLRSDDLDIGAGPDRLDPPSAAWLRAHERGRPLVGPPIEHVLINGPGRSVRCWDDLMRVR